MQASPIQAKRRSGRSKASESADHRALANRPSYVPKHTHLRLTLDSRREQGPKDGCGELRVIQSVLDVDSAGICNTTCLVVAECGLSGNRRRGQSLAFTCQQPAQLGEPMMLRTRRSAASSANGTWQVIMRRSTSSSRLVPLPFI